MRANTCTSRPSGAGTCTRLSTTTAVKTMAEKAQMEAFGGALLQAEAAGGMGFAGGHAGGTLSGKRGSRATLGGTTRRTFSSFSSILMSPARRPTSAVLVPS